MKNQQQDLKFSMTGKDPSNLKSYGAYTLVWYVYNFSKDHIKSNLKSEDEDFRKLEVLSLKTFIGFSVT